MVACRCTAGGGEIDAPCLPALAPAAAAAGAAPAWGLTCMASSRDRLPLALAGLVGPAGGGASLSAAARCCCSASCCLCRLRATSASLPAAAARSCLASALRSL